MAKVLALILCVFALAPLPANAQINDLEKELSQIKPPDPEALQRAGAALITNSGDPSRLVYEPERLAIGIRDTKSGLDCHIPLAAASRARVNVTNGVLQCGYTANISEQWRVYPLSNFKGETADPDTYLIALILGMLENTPDAKLLPAQKSAIENKLALLLQPGARYLMRRLDIPLNGVVLRNIFAVADVNGWRFLYIAFGDEDPIEALAPTAFISSISSLEPSTSSAPPK